ncbi:SusC/RagA family TonB-linked outer membrane protein [Ornithobacterium rhinotracheale]|uniref:SusC/RagA family TonB-linked outer membrane protein n=1 Tax=Ornithobacterium rhinotracheale TaxID=28251 RepID=UPI001FF3A761|nr:SusC/RagA family TonB-linked outer membrane protein [Ornithobacterium rhinotracheale]MCK0199813.1 SusC/RagA family TonB-linked outer membrane protein [Ornithobacterium rhinotracheale]
MRRNLTRLFAIGAFCLSFYAYGQQKPITGRVLDSNGFPIQDAYVYVEGSDKGVYTDENGNYTIEAKDGDVLGVEFIGFDTKNIKVGDVANYDVKLHEGKGTIGLKELVATALGIEREEKALGYAVSSLKSEDLNVAKDANLINNLAGKASGVNVYQQSGTVGGSSKIILRGATSISGDNQPLIVVDGMPTNNSYVDNGIAGAVDYGNPVGDINPNDIKEMSILKGAAATALYGSRAKNGAIIITTKTGEKGKVSIVYDATMRVDAVAKLPNYQNVYAQGTLGKYDVEKFNGWGPEISKVSGEKFKNFLGQDVTLQAYPDNVRNFFNKGITRINSISMSGGNIDGDFRLAYANTYVTGIMPYSKYKNDNVSFNVRRKLSDNLKISASGTYSRSVRDGLSAQGSNDPNILIDGILGMPRTANPNLLREYTYHNGDITKQYFWDGKKVNNPYFILDNNKISSDVERFFGNASIDFKFNSWLSMQNRTGIDFSTDSRRTIYAKGTAGELTGKFIDGLHRFRVLNNDFIISANKEVSPKLKLSANLGHNIYQKEYFENTNTAQNLIEAGLFNYANALSNNPTNYQSLKRTIGVYGEFVASYDETLFLTLTGRNDWTSTLPKENNSYFYPSVSLSYLFSENLKSQKWLNYGKVRLNWANVGSDEAPYQLDFLYTNLSSWFSQYGAGGTYPFDGKRATAIPRVLPNRNLKPQNQISYEAGLEMKMFKNRVNLDASFYYIDTKDQIVSIDVPLSTGYFAKKINAGLVRNVGVEVDLGLIPIRTEDFQWNMNFTFAKNKSTVQELTPDLESYVLTSGWAGLQIQALKGESFSIVGTGYRRSPDGQLIINEKTGLVETKSDQNLGTIDPDFRLGFVNNFRYKNFTLNAVLDWRQGGKMYSGTVASLRSAGLVEETLAHRGEKFVMKGVNEIKDANGKVTYKENTTPVKDMETYWGHMSATKLTESNVYDATYLKLRSVSLSYRLPSKLLNSNVIKGLTVGIEGRNLWNIIDNVPHVDPELNFFGPSATGGGVEFNSVPLTRSIGMNLKVNF